MVVGLDEIVPPRLTEGFDFGNPICLDSSFDEKLESWHTFRASLAQAYPVETISRRVWAFVRYSGQKVGEIVAP